MQREIVMVGGDTWEQVFDLNSPWDKLDSSWKDISNLSLNPQYTKEEKTLNDLTRGELTGISWHLGTTYLQLQNKDLLNYTWEQVFDLDAPWPDGALNETWENAFYIDEGIRVSPTFRFKFIGEAELTISIQSEQPENTNIQLEYSLDNGGTWSSINDGQPVTLTENEITFYDLQTKQILLQDANNKTITPTLSKVTTKLKLIDGNLRMIGELLFKGRSWGQDIESGVI